MLNEIIEHEKFTRDGFDNITEARGIYDLSHNIINSCYEFINNNINKLLYIGDDDDGKTKIYKGEFKVPLNDDSFIVDPVIILTIYLSDIEHDASEDSGSFLLPNINDLQDNKLVNPLFHVRIFENYIRHVTYSRFKNVMLHEIHHAYRWFNVNVKSSNNDSEKKAFAQYKEFNKVKNNSEIDKILFFINYYGDLDEINAFKTEIYSTVESNPNINRENYREYLTQFAIYRNIQWLKKNLDAFVKYSYKEATDQYAIISNKMNKAMKTNYSPQVNRKRLISFLSHRIMFMQKEFYKILGKAFQDLNRYNNNQTESVRKVSNFLIDDLNHFFNN